MNRKVIFSVIGLVVLAGLVGILVMKKPASAPSGTSDMSNMPANTNTTSQQNTKAEATDKVAIKDFAFSPGAITVKKGTKVTWTNQDATRHNIAPDDETADFKTSDLLAKGESYSVTFNTTGTFTYHCTPHPYMKGTIVVTE